MISNALIIIASLSQASNYVFPEDIIAASGYSYIHLEQEGMPL